MGGEGRVCVPFSPPEQLAFPSCSSSDTVGLSQSCPVEYHHFPMSGWGKVEDKYQERSKGEKEETVGGF